MLNEEVSAKILLLASNPELARRQLGSCSKGWLKVHRQSAWQTLELAAVQAGAPPFGQHATVRQFANAMPSLQREIAGATLSLKLSIVKAIGLTAHCRAFAQCPFRSVEHLTIDGPEDNADADDHVDEFRWGVIFAPMLSTARSFTLTTSTYDLCSHWHLGRKLLKSLLFSFARLHTIDLTCETGGMELSAMPDDGFDLSNLIAAQGLFHIEEALDPARAWVTKATNLERLGLSFEDVPHDKVVQFFVSLSAACPKIRGLKITFCGIRITPDIFRVLPRGLETLCLQFDSYNEIDTILSKDDKVTERNSKDIENFLKQWVRPHCNLIVQDGLLIQTLDECLGP